VVLHLARDRLICILAHHDALADNAQLLRTLVGEDHGLAVTLTHAGLQWQTAVSEQ
jgi:hypothetical protein